MFWNRRLNKRITVDEEFDADDPMARAMRSLVPPDAPMDPQSRDYMMGHLFSIQRRLSRQRDRHPEPQRLRPALVPAIAILVVLAVMAAVMLPVFLGGRGGAPVQQAQVARFGSIAGKVLVLAPGGKWRAASARDRIGQGWRVRTASGGKASVDFGDQSIMRVTESSEARIARLGSREISVEHVSGGTYHRVHKGTRYTVFNSDVASHALGTAFNIENRVPGHLEILTVESAVEVAIGSHGPIKVAQGEVMTVSMSEDKKADKQPVSRERLQDERLMASVKRRNWDPAAGVTRDRAGPAGDRAVAGGRVRHGRHPDVGGVRRHDLPGPGPPALGGRRARVPRQRDRAVYGYVHHVRVRQ
jgi:hypothetical protein